MDDLKRKLNNLNIENIIWIIFIFLSTLAIISNYYEAKFLKNKNKSDRKLFRNINIFILFVALLIYIYYVYLNYGNITNLRKKVSSNQKILFQNISLIVSIIFLIGGIGSLILAIIARGDESPDIEF